MKSNEEFLSKMWEDISKIEYEEAQKQLAKQRNLVIVKKTIILYSSVFVLFTILLLISLFGELSIFQNGIYLLALIFLIVGYFADSFHSSLIGGGN